MSLSKEERKRAASDYKQRKPRRGVFAVRCLATGRAWVGSSQDLGAAHNATWFMLRVGSLREASLQAEWRAHGEAQFRFEVLEELDEDVAPVLLADVLKRKKTEWAQRESATVLPR